MRYFPIFLDLKDKLVIVAGGGAAATNKIALFAKTDARLVCVAHDFSEEIRAYAAAGRVALIEADPKTYALDDAAIVIAATESDADGAIAERARAGGILVNAVDKTELCAFITPSIVDRGKIVIAIGTEGSAPVLARRLREQVEIAVPGNIGALAEFIGRHRSEVSAMFPDTPRRRAFWEDVADGEIGHLVLSGEEERAVALLRQELARRAAGEPAPPSITLVAAPTDADDLTIRALRALQNADAVFYDENVAPAVLDRARRDARRVRIALNLVSGPDLAEHIANLAEEARRLVLLLSGVATSSEMDHLGSVFRASGYVTTVCCR